jgi:hypothetical protein
MLENRTVNSEILKLEFLVLRFLSDVCIVGKGVLSPPFRLSLSLVSPHIVGYTR